MNEYLISMYIDDELSLDEKIEFVETTHGDETFKDVAISLLEQENLIRTDVVDRVPSIAVQKTKKISFPYWRPIGIFATGLAAAMIIAFFTLPSQEKLSIPYRFIIYQPEVNQVDITGSFIEWNTLPMKKVGNSGYWEITLALPKGEHRFSYIVEGGQRLADPTILTREHDDFGGVNSILEVNLQA